MTKGAGTMRTIKTERVWMVTNTETHGGCSVRATTAKAAAKKALRRGWLGKAPKSVEARTFVGLPLIRLTLNFD
jgi:hypothetical protein